LTKHVIQHQHWNSSSSSNKRLRREVGGCDGLDWGYLVLERKSASKSMVYTDRDPMPMFSNSCTQDRISPLNTQIREKDEMR
jgi:hypothetical protein